MKKYKLKKDFSFLKAGDEVFLDFDCRKEKEFVEVYTLKSTYIGNMEVLKNTTSEFFEKIPEKPKSVWDLKEGDDYYYYYLDLNSSYSEVADFTILGVDAMITYKDDGENGNIFLNYEEAEKELERRKAIQKIKKYCWENGIETEYGINNDIGFILSPLGRIDFQKVRRNGNPIGYFSEENAEKILEKFEEELKIILDV